MIVTLFSDNFENWNELALHIVEFEEDFIEFILDKKLTFVFIKN